MDFVADRTVRRPFDNASVNYDLGFFYSGIAMNIVLEFGIAVDANWGDVKTELREKIRRGS